MKRRHFLKSITLALFAAPLVGIAKHIAKQTTRTSPLYEHYVLGKWKIDTCTGFDLGDKNHAVLVRVRKRIDDGMRRNLHDCDTYKLLDDAWDGAT